MRVKDKLHSRDMEVGEELIEDTLPNQNTSTDDDIDIKYEEIGFPFLYSTSDSEDKSNLDPDIDNVPNIPHVACESDQTEQYNPIDFYTEPVMCVRGCEACQKDIKTLSKHIRTSHTPLQPIQDPLPIDPQQAHHSLSIPIKSEMGEDIVKIECSKQDSQSKLESDLDIELDSDGESDPDYSASTRLTRNVRRRGLIGNNSSESKSSRAKKKLLPSPEQLKCNVCDKSFSKKGYLNVHRRIHTGERPYKCDVCEKTFARSDYLTRHKRIHTGEKFQCNVCEKALARSENLNRHMRTHTGVKPYECDLCEKCFSMKHHLAMHKRIHTGEKPYECPVCQKRFKTLAEVAQHKRVHTRDKPYKCEEFDKCFSHTSSLTGHKRSHTGETPFKCAECEKYFSTASQLSRHRRMHTT